MTDAEREQSGIEKWNKAPRVPWNGADLLYSEGANLYMDREHFDISCRDHELLGDPEEDYKVLRFYIAVPDEEDNNLWSPGPNVPTLKSLLKFAKSAQVRSGVNRAGRQRPYGCG